MNAIGITTLQSVYAKLENKKYAIISRKEFIIPKSLNTPKQRLNKDWGKLGKDDYLKNVGSFRYRRFRYFYFLPCSKIPPVVDLMTGSITIGISNFLIFDETTLIIFEL